jgi:hypothetical protein
MQSFASHATTMFFPHFVFHRRAKIRVSQNFPAAFPKMILSVMSLK